MKTAEEIMTSHPLSNVPKYQMTNAEEHTWITDCMQEYAEQFKPKWVSVEEGLPEIDADSKFSVDLLVKGKIYVYGEFAHIGTTIGWCNKDGEWNNILPEKQKCFVTEYMPIPE